MAAGRRRRARGLLRGALWMGWAFSACGVSCSRYPLRDASAPAELRVVAEPKNASVYVNERFLASAERLARRPVKLKPGKKRITVEARGYFPHDLEVDLPPGLTTIEIKLRPVPP